jgi:hypothetical protein
VPGLFGASFIGARLLFGNLINASAAFVGDCLPVGGTSACYCCGWHRTHWALAGAALSGFGFSLVFPALGVERSTWCRPPAVGGGRGLFAVHRLVAGDHRPLAGAIAAGFGFASIFLFAALAAERRFAAERLLYRHNGEARAD